MTKFLTFVGAATTGAMLLTAPMPGEALVSRENFFARTTQDLVELCNVQPDDPRRTQALTFCHGYMTGIMQYHNAVASQRRARPVYCLPEAGAITYDDVTNRFVEWARANPGHMDSAAVIAFGRYLSMSYPCEQLRRGSQPAQPDRNQQRDSNR
jgi:Rap1a immunity proteins